jgi:capsular exopolysaccharide synthesis family protein
MTTLPTTSIRYPRPAPGVPAVHAPAGPSPLSPQPGAALTTSDVIRVLRSNLWLIILSVIVFGGLGVAANWYLGKYYPKYTARGWVQVSVPAVFDPMGTLRNSGTDTTIAYEQRTQVALLRSDGLWSAVLAQPDNKIRQTDWFRGFIVKQVNADGSVSERPDIPAAKESLERNFSVSPVTDSKLIVVEMSTAKPQDARDIVEAIVNEHLENQKRTSNDRNSNERTLRQNMLRTYQGRLREVQNSLNEAAVKVGAEGSGPTLGGRLSVTEMQLSQLLSRLLEVEAERTSAETFLQMMQSSIANGVDPPAVERIVQNHPEILRYRSIVDELNVSIRIQSMEHGDNHRIVKQLVAQRDEWLNKLDERTREVRIQARGELLETAQQAVQTQREETSKLEKQIDLNRKKLADDALALTEYLSLRSESEDLKALIQELQRQVDTFQAATQAEGTGIMWSQQPRIPDQRSFPKLSIMLPLGILVGLALSLGIAFLREVMDTSVRSPRDIARVGQMNLLGIIPHEDDDPQAQTAPLPLAISQAPQSIIAEQFRQVRTRLQHTASLETTRSILITSPGPQDGKSTVAANLAAGFALNGRRILLVDANFRRPELHRIFGSSNESGLATVLSGKSSLESTVHKTAVPNLDVLSAGPKPENATELLEGPALTDFIDRALEEYDHVLFDSGPLLFVSETVALAPRVDGVVTVVRARTNSRGLLQRMRDGLRQLKAEHLGVVLNAVRAQAGGYYNRNIKTYYEYQNGKH